MNVSQSIARNEVDGASLALAYAVKGPFKTYGKKAFDTAAPAQVLDKHGKLVNVK